MVRHDIQKLTWFWQLILSSKWAGVKESKLVLKLTLGGVIGLRHCQRDADQARANPSTATWIVILVN